MRLVQVAKVLGMTGQQLRKELETIDFGVRPTDREISASLAQGIIRYFARERGIVVDMAALGFEEGGGEKPAQENLHVATKEAVQVETPETEKPSGASKKNLNVLRKLTLEGVSKAAIEEQEHKLQGSRAKSAKARSAKAVPAQKADVVSYQEQIKKKEGVVMLPALITVKEFAEKTGIQVPKVIQSLMQNGVMATITQNIDYETAAIVASDLGVDVQKEEGMASAEDILSRNLEELLKDEPENLLPRPPVVAVMGHVDHGKTSILDAIRKAEVAKGEAGGITQHIGAYQLEYTSKGSETVHKITFIDTPGHEAFTAMRARGAQVTDIVVLVVAADEGVKPTTIEAINHAKDAGVPILVAMNKIDREGADPERVKGELSGYDLQPEEWGGKTPYVLCSALTKQGIPELLDSIVLLGDMQELKVNPNRLAIATVVESHLDQSLGPLATVIVNTGTLRVGDAFVCGRTMGKVRMMIDARDARFDEAGPSAAVRLSGFSDVSQVGDILQVVPSEQQARHLVDAVKSAGDQRKKRSFADLVSRLSEGKLKQLKVVLKADAQGSLDAIYDTLMEKTTEEVTVKVIHGAIGSVTETDVMMAAASDGIVVAFNVTVPSAVARAAEREGVKLQEYDVIYKLFEDIDGLLSGLVVPDEEEKIVGHLEIKAVFMAKKAEQVVGGRVTDGSIKRLPFRLLRDGQKVGEGRITNVRKVDKDIKEAKEGEECGVRTECGVTIAEGDLVEVYVKELKKKP